LQEGGIGGLSGGVDLFHPRACQRPQTVPARPHRAEQAARGCGIRSRTFAPIDPKPQAFDDLFRMNGGVIVELWDVIEAVPTEGLANGNGLFGGLDAN
jgi:hypothetical protein